MLPICKMMIEFWIIWSGYDGKRVTKKSDFYFWRKRLPNNFGDILPIAPFYGCVVLFCAVQKGDCNFVWKPEEKPLNFRTLHRPEGDDDQSLGSWKRIFLYVSELFSSNFRFLEYIHIYLYIYIYRFIFYKDVFEHIWIDQAMRNSFIILQNGGVCSHNEPNSAKWNRIR